MERKNTLAEPITPAARTAAGPRRWAARGRNCCASVAYWPSGWAGCWRCWSSPGPTPLWWPTTGLDFNATIYENYRIVNLPHTTELFRHEGNGRTSYGENGLVVDKAVNFDVPRLLFIGDSYVEAKQVSNPDKFTELLEK